jgi:hypothetical protein
MKFGSGKTNTGPRPLIIADENKQIIYGRATAEQIRKANAALKLTEEEKERLPAPALYVGPISIEIFLSYLRIYYGDHPIIRRRFPEPRNIVVSEEILREISKEIILTEDDGIALRELQEKYETSGIERPNKRYIPDEEAEKLMEGQKWESPWKKHR